MYIFFFNKLTNSYKNFDFLLYSIKNKMNLGLQKFNLKTFAPVFQAFVYLKYVFQFLFL